MIAASEPLEFVPHGRTVLAKHPGQIYGKQTTSASETSLLYRLTNFAIKDETLLVDKEEEEWWCIREVFYRESDGFEDDPAPPKDAKFDYNSESFRPTSRLKNDFNMSIKSELLNKKHDAESNFAGGSRTGSANSSSNMSKKFNLNSGNGTAKKKQLNPKTDCSYEEELYVSGCTAVWSKGLISTPGTKVSGPEQRETICCYTIDSPIKHASFANFHIDIKNTMLIDALNSQIGDVKKNIKIEDTTEHIKTEIMPSIVILDSKCMRVYATDGREYITSTPFQVKKVWPMKYGVLLEKNATPPPVHQSSLPASFFRFNDSHNSSYKCNRMNMSSKLRNDSEYDHDIPLPICFSLTHPLDEVTPILIKSPSQGLQYYSDGDLQIIFVSTNPSIILIYDWKLAIHSLWRIRKATRDECLSMCPAMNTTTFSQTCDYISSPMHSNRNVTSWATGLGSPYQSRKAPNTPTKSKLNSPMANAFHQQGLSPHASIGQASSVSMLPNSAGITPPSLPLYPDICIDHIWTDNLTIKRDTVENPGDLKTFLHTDLIGHDYLCFIAKQNSVSKLQILRLQKSHSRGGLKTNLIVGTVSTVMAKDAVVLTHLKMIALIDEAGNIILQSGNNVVGKVHVGGVLARLIDSPYTKRSTFRSPFPRRSSLLPSRVNDATFDDSALHLLSPVPHTSAASRLEKNDSLGLSGLCDAAGSSLTLQFEAGVMYRISLPALSCSALVTRCCSALTAILPKDITMQVLIKWYGVRNAPGTQDLTPLQEWGMFSNVLLSLIGYDTERLNQHADDQEHTETVSKKQRTSSDGSVEDWDYLLNSKMHKTIGNPLSAMLKLPTLSSESKHRHIKTEDDKPGQLNTTCILFPYTLQILYSFHLVYEEIKLNTLLSNDLKPLCSFLYQISKDLKLEKYVNHYWLDFPIDFSLDSEYECQVSEDVASKLVEPSYFSKEPPNVFSYMNSMFKDVDVGYYPYLADVNNMSRDLIEILSITGCGRSAGVQTITSRDNMASSTPRGRRDSSLNSAPVYCQAVTAMCERGITPRDIDNLPPALALAAVTVLSRWAANAISGETPNPFVLVMREELALHQQVPNDVHGVEALALEVIEKETAYSVNSEPIEEHTCKSEENDSTTGMEHLNTKLLSLLYPMDHRMTEVFNILQSSQPVTINLSQRPEVSDHDFIEEQEKYLYALSTRTMALPVARGMLTLRTQASSPTEAAVVPRVCVWGRTGGTGTGAGGRAAIAPPGGELSAQALAWPSFHSGVAAGLALLPTTGSTLDSTWLLYNKPKGTTEMSPEHSGFLMALGLNGHLRDMPFMHMYEYLVKCNEMLSVGLLLGLAATYRGTMDIQATKLMSIHLEPLLPPTSIELDIQQNILVAALLGVGLLYQGSEHHHYAQALLHEIGRVRVWSAERCVEREGYALAAGLALGMLLAGAGNRAPTHVVHALRTYMLGGELPDSQKDRHKNSNGVEGGTINLDVTSPGATLALGLVYMRSGAAAPASWLQPPRTPYELDFVRPDLLMLRVIARGLILWDDIEASDEWIENQVPDTIRPYCFVKPTEDNIDYEAMNQAYCNIIAGACFAMGIRFAGSGDEDARDSALSVAKRLLRLASRTRAELAGRATLECCLCVCLLAASMIMAGRGDIEVLRLCRRLRVRVPAAGAHPAHAPLTHGGQMAVHMCVGLLFLMGGRGTLGTSRAAVAALLAAFFPKFPTHTEDNRYHLQAFRHLYVLAVEPRLLLPRDLNTGKLCYAHIQVIDLKGVTIELKAPCMIPELSTLQEVKINDPRYWPVSFHRHNNWDLLKKFLELTWCIDVKQRAGCLSYVDDPQGFLTILAQTLTLDKSNIWSVKPDYIQLFAKDDKIRNFVKHYLNKETNDNICADCLIISKKRKGVKNEAFLNRNCTCRRYSLEEQEHVQALSMVMYECLLKDMMCALPIWTAFLKIIKTMKTEPTSNNMWQIKLLLSQIEHHNRTIQDQMTVDGQESSEPLISSEYTLAIKQKVCHTLDNWELKLTPFLRKYLGLPSSKKLTNCEDSTKRNLSAFIVYHDLQRNVLKDSDSDNELAVLISKEALTAEALSKIETLVR